MTDATVAIDGGQVERGPGRWMMWAVAIGLAGVLVVGAIVIVTRSGGARGGGASPEEVADKLIEAINGEDMLALAELIEPAERRSLMDPMFEIVDELGRLGILQDDVDMASISGIEIELTDVS